MKAKEMKHPFKKKETGFHKFAVMQLAEWVGGITEMPFYIEGAIAFVPDVVTFEKGRVNMYEVVYTHEINGKKLGMIQNWCYRNATVADVFEITAEYILSHTEKPDYFRNIEHFEIDVL